jgi:ribonuclease T1
MTAANRRAYLGLAVAVLVALLAWYLQGNSGGDPVGPTATRAPQTAIDPGDGGVDPDSGLAVISIEELPGEGRRTLALIDAGGPFPERRDGVTFENREDLLPPRQRGYYHEYTVPTPGSNDRGARRIVTGGAEEFYYTDDHYDSFRRIAR